METKKTSILHVLIEAESSIYIHAILYIVILLMEDILHQLRLVVNQSHYFENFLHPRSQVVQDDIAMY